MLFDIVEGVCDTRKDEPTMRHTILCLIIALLAATACFVLLPIVGLLLLYIFAPLLRPGLSVNVARKRETYSNLLFSNDGSQLAANFSDGLRVFDVVPPR
jgi:hypothetical protein